MLVNYLDRREQPETRIAGAFAPARCRPGPWTRRARRPALLDVDLGADVSELLLDRGGLVLGDAFLDRLWRSLGEILRFLEAQAGDLANDLDDVDLVGADLGQDGAELGLLFRRRGAARRRAAAGRHGHRHRPRRAACRRACPWAPPPPRSRRAPARAP